MLELTERLANLLKFLGVLLSRLQVAENFRRFPGEEQLIGHVGALTSVVGGELCEVAEIDQVASGALLEAASQTRTQLIVLPHEQFPPRDGRQGCEQDGSVVIDGDLEAVVLAHAGLAESNTRAIVGDYFANGPERRIRQHDDSFLQASHANRWGQMGKPHPSKDPRCAGLSTVAKGTPWGLFRRSFP